MKREILMKNKYPKLSNSVSLEKDVFDNNKVYLLKCPEKNLFAELNVESFTALSFFNGENSIEQIAYNLATKFSATKDNIIDDLIDLSNRLELLDIITIY